MGFFWFEATIRSFAPIKALSLELYSSLGFICCRASLISRVGKVVGMRECERDPSMGTIDWWPRQSFLKINVDQKLKSTAFTVIHVELPQLGMRATLADCWALGLRAS
jgi:hypothetical protein